jgi:hypothetical protein
MGQVFGSERGLDLANISNDYELVCRASKMLECLLSEHWDATGQSLHDQIANVEGGAHGPEILALIDNMHFLADIRSPLPLSLFSLSLSFLS